MNKKTIMEKVSDLQQYQPEFYGNIQMPDPVEMEGVTLSVVIEFKKLPGVVTAENIYRNICDVLEKGSLENDTETQSG